jgi:hypothetical protein
MRDRFLALAAKHKSRTLNVAETSELKDLIAKLKLATPDGSQYCYCDTSGFACNPDSPPPNCNCICGDVP